MNVDGSDEVGLLGSLHFDAPDLEIPVKSSPRDIIVPANAEDRAVDGFGYRVRTGEYVAEFNGRSNTQNVEEDGCGKDAREPKEITTHRLGVGVGWICVLFVGGRHCRRIRWLRVRCNGSGSGTLINADRTLIL
jgi:hypothetical protein